MVFQSFFNVECGSTDEASLKTASISRPILSGGRGGGMAVL